MTNMVQIAKKQGKKPLTKPITDFIEGQRVIRKITKTELAEAMGIAPRQYYRYVCTGFNDHQICQALKHLGYIIQIVPIEGANITKL